jgi:hypothetical protein
MSRFRRFLDLFTPKKPKKPITLGPAQPYLLVFSPNSNNKTAEYEVSPEPSESNFNTATNQSKSLEITDSTGIPQDWRHLRIGGNDTDIGLNFEELDLLSRKTGRGHFLTYVLSRDAFKHRWVPRQSYFNSNRLTTEDLKLVNRVITLYDVREYVTVASSWTLTFGQCAIVKVHNVPGLIDEPWTLKAVDYQLPDLIFRDDGKLDYMRCFFYVGWNYTEFHVPAKNIVFFKYGQHRSGNPYFGQSVLEAPYKSLISSINIMDGWAKLILQRGLGLIDIAIKGADPVIAEKIKTEYSDPSQFSVFVHDENIVVNAQAGIVPGFDMENTAKIFNKDIAAGSGISFTKFEGGDDRVTGALADQDNYASSHQLLHTKFHDAIVSVVEMMEPKLKKKIGFDFVIEIKLDRKTQLELQSTFVTMAMTLPELFTPNDARRYLDKDIVDGDDEIDLAEYLFNKKVKMYGKEKALQLMGIGDQEKTPKTDAAGKNDNHVKGNSSVSLKNDRKDLKDKKKKSANTMVRPQSHYKNDSYSYNEINDTLRNLYGEGFSQTTIKEIMDSNYTEVYTPSAVFMKARNIICDKLDLEKFPNSISDIVKTVKETYPQLVENEILDFSIEIHRRKQQ